MRILAFDQSSRTGWASGADNVPMKQWSVGMFRAPRRPEEGERLIIVEDSVLELIDRFSPNLLVFETPYDPSWDNARRLQKGDDVRVEYSRSTMNFLISVRAAIIMAAARRSIPTEDYGTRTWRSILKLPPPPIPPTHDSRGNPMTPAKAREWQRKWIKAATLKKVRAMGIAAETEDQADAAGLCLYALHGKPAAARGQNDLFEMARKRIA